MLADSGARGTMVFTIHDLRGRIDKKGKEEEWRSARFQGKTGVERYLKVSRKRSAVKRRGETAGQNHPRRRSEGSSVSEQPRK